MTPFYSRQLKIEWGQCDPAGIVFAPRYLDMFAESTVRMFEWTGLPRKREMLREMNVIGYPLIDVSARFLRPTTYGDEVMIQTAAPVFGNSSFTVEHRLMLDRTVCVECTEKRVWAGPDPERAGGIRGVRVPDSIRALFGQ
jgi:4-hydroxybenzoyl-CoA thioesterase